MYSRAVLIFLLLSISCKSASVNTLAEKSESYDVVNTLFENLGKKKLVNTSLTSLSTSDADELDQYFDYSFLNMNPLVSPDGEKIKFEELLTENDLKQLKARAKDLKAIKFNKDLLDQDIKLVKKMSDDSVSVSTAIFTENNEFAFLFMEYQSGADLVCFKFSDGKWNRIAIIGIWIS